MSNAYARRLLRLIPIAGIAVAVLAVGMNRPAAAETSPLVAEYLESGKLDEGEAFLIKELQQRPQDNQLRFSLGMLQFLKAVERLAQAQYDYGLLQHRMRALPFVRLPVPENKDPAEISYVEARLIAEQFGDRIKTAEATLAKVNTENVKLPIHFGRIRLDINNDGQTDASEEFWRIFANFNRRVTETDGRQFVINFDGGDVHWLRGYCHLLMFFSDFALAHDWQDLFERTAILFYPRVKTPHAFLMNLDRSTRQPWDWGDFADIIAFVHLINFPVHDATRLQSAHAHLEAMVVQSRASWKRILAETDNDAEWLPNPQQTGVIPGVAVRQDMITSWHDFLDEAEALLAGKKLVPFWRKQKTSPEHPPVGVNLRKAFLEPRPFDLVMWISGTAATPYLETGEITKPEVWRQLQRVFGGEFFGFAIWFN